MQGLYSPISQQLTLWAHSFSYVRPTSRISSLTTLRRRGRQAHNMSTRYPHDLAHGDEQSSVSGKKQSPVDINSDKQLFKPMKKMVIDYDSARPAALINTGHSFQVNMSGNSVLSGGPLAHSYKLLQFHNHWGQTCSDGSEHTVDGTYYASELHLVHWNTDLYPSPQEAISGKSGVTVFGVFLKEGKEHPEWQKIVKLLPEIKYKGAKFPLTNFDFNTKNILPENVEDYWTYMGSLTTSPFYETVQWVIFKEPVEISHEQLEAFRHLLSHKEEDQPEGEDGRITRNNRPVKELYGRTIFSSSK